MNAPLRGRPATIDTEATVVLDATMARTRIQIDSDRRAVVNHLITSGGRATVKKINAHFGFDMKNVILALVRSGWVKLERTPT